MVREYFKGFSFTEPVYKPRDTLPVKLVPVKSGEISVEEAKISRIHLTGFSDIKVVTPPNVGSLDELLVDFERTLEAIGHNIDSNLTMKGKLLFFVDPNALEPKTEGELDWLVDRYGEYMRGGGGGDCRLLESGAYLLSVAIPKDKDIATKSNLLETAAHEYGHTLGNRLKSATYEEIKAYAFASLFLRFYDKSENHPYEEIRTDLRSDRPHDLAIHRLGELLRAGVPESPIIAHLISRRFGKFGPRDYLKFLQKTRKVQLSAVA